MRNAHAQQWSPALAKAEAKNAVAVQHAAQKTAEVVHQLVQEKAFRMKAAEKLAASEKEWQLTKAGLMREKKALEAEHAAAQGAATQFQVCTPLCPMLPPLCPMLPPLCPMLPRLCPMLPRLCPMLPRLGPMLPRL